MRVTLNLIDVRGGPDGQAPPDVIEPAELTSWPGARGPLLSGVADSWAPCEGLVRLTLVPYGVQTSGQMILALGTPGRRGSWPGVSTLG